tara:strand:- start:108381 stop:108536 length:156 start_codon:yes stop_codon:yes gene_type:complete
MKFENKVIHRVAASSGMGKIVAIKLANLGEKIVSLRAAKSCYYLYLLWNSY